MIDNVNDNHFSLFQIVGQQVFAEDVDDGSTKLTFALKKRIGPKICKDHSRTVNNHNHKKEIISIKMLFTYFSTNLINILQSQRFQ